MIIKDETTGQYLQLSPGEEIIFKREEGETTGMLVMTNLSNCNVAYKVPTNPLIFKLSSSQHST